MATTTPAGNKMSVSDGLLSVAEAAHFLSISRAKLYSLMDAGDLAYAKIGKSRRIPRRALVEFAERHLVCAGWPTTEDTRC
jgi:excisionase family DNA binding protein